jgi:predicted phosphoribosyltransferase
MTSRTSRVERAALPRISTERMTLVGDREKCECGDDGAATGRQMKAAVAMAIAGSK